MQKVRRFLGALMVLALFTSFVGPEKEAVHWMTLKEVQEAYSKSPKPIIVDVYTSWCGWCKVMDKQTYSNPKVAAYINEKYYAVKFDAESKESVDFNGRRYSYNATNKMNDMAVYLLFGQMSFPTTVFLSSLDARPAPLSGFLKPKEIESPLRFFGDGIYKSKSFPEFQKNFAASW
jgi:uncharacterized protein YyaL (SSP411 family)